MINMATLLSNLLSILAATVLIGLTFIAVVFVGTFVCMMVRHMIKAARKGE